MAHGDAGLKFINSLAQYTGADVAGSDDLTGSPLLGGDWDFEVRVGVINVNSIFIPGTSIVLALDTIAPALISLTLPTTIDLSAGATTATFSAQAQDNNGGAGVDHVTIFLDHSIYRGFAASNFEIGGSFGSGSDTFLDGIPTTANTSFSLGALTNSGVYNITKVWVYDLASNRAIYSDSQLQALGIKTSFTVTDAVAVNQTLTGTSGNDSFTSGPGNDSIDGGAGIDTVTYSGARAAYTLTRNGSTYTVHANSGSDGTDTLTNIESLKFTDMSVNLTVQAKAAAAPQADVNHVTELYVAFFNRVPDADGLAYWIDQMNAGQSLNQIAESFYSAGVTYSDMTGFSAGMSNQDFINVFYKNVLGRPDGADAGGLAYWNEQLATCHSTRSSLGLDIVYAAHNFKGDQTWGWVADLLDNKIAVAKTFAIDLGLNYNTDNDSITHGVAIAAAVTPTSTDAAIALIGLSGSEMQLG